jgi:hypothetical protein
VATTIDYCLSMFFLFFSFFCFISISVSFPFPCFPRFLACSQVGENIFRPSWHGNDETPILSSFNSPYGGVDEAGKVDSVPTGKKGKKGGPGNTSKRPLFCFSGGRARRHVALMLIWCAQGRRHTISGKVCVLSELTLTVT